MSVSSCEINGRTKPAEIRGNNLEVGRLHREWLTMSAMVHIYCRGHRHSGNDLCADCRELLAYAEVRLKRCRFGAEKPTCAKCPVHCYAPGWREKVRAMMRYSGPRMLWRHPILALLHMADGRRGVNKAPSL